MKKIVIVLGVIALSVLGFLSCKRYQERDKQFTTKGKPDPKIAMIIVTDNGEANSLYSRHLSSYYLELFSALAIAVLTTSVVYLVTRLLDRKFQWNEVFFSRIILQAILGLAIPSVVAYLLMIMICRLLNLNTIGSGYDLVLIPIILVLVIGFNVYLLAEKIGIPIKDSIPIIDPPDTQSTPIRGNLFSRQPDEFTVHTPTGVFSLPLDEIAYFYRRKGYVYLRRSNGTNHIVAQSLDQIQNNIPKDKFFRTSRHMLASYNSIADYYSLDHGKLGLRLNPVYEAEVTISKLQKNSFKNWLEKGKVIIDNSASLA
ncbi:LytTR family transcriptional regulator DNA-binding domain-containing protein [Chitinophaga oryzae]|uniref:LytTR family transcriptional regulator DNA-binding domain-containing protein n=1 Tax=Chitinophaga oryzae TaxID=2725414 RepID=A0AAE6ZN99_9BACT|nr:LytTR family DNA-binding domain-containing protein [Chitinophaga oryzae]QJB34900.1 LytTR family transcriptional regulator DNA-binding domain-containing protein [Chitinophaga oryzae]QJB41411.1 LytTR family transcriptional regulator DNA-binding domain-containing protein [Chitinophaga oryzae]